MCDSGNDIRSLQLIDAGGSKRFLAGGLSPALLRDRRSKERRAGCVSPKNSRPERRSIEATGSPVAIAFNAGNLGPVARALRKQILERSVDSFGLKLARIVVDELSGGRAARRVQVERVGTKLMENSVRSQS